MTISILGIILLIGSVAVVALIVGNGIIGKVTGNVGSSSAYDTLASLKSEYSALNNSYAAVKSQASKSSNSKIKNDSIDAELQLTKAQYAISDVESALSTDQSQDVINERLATATNQLKVTQRSVNTVTGEV